MKYPKIYRLDLWEVILISLSIGLLIVSYYCKDNFTISTLIGTSTCILTAILILYFQRIHRKLALYSYYNPISGKYIRIDIGQDNTGGVENTDIREKNVNLEINIAYLGENKFSATIQYWKHENAEALSSFEFSETNKMIASGTYKYTKGQSFTNHFGSLTLFLLENEPNRIHVRYHHVFPRQTDYNPDNNRGWEIWERESTAVVAQES
jgi:hypothetical protein